MHETKEYPIVRFDDAGNEVYREDINGFWTKREYDEAGRQVFWETCAGDWVKRQYDDAGNEIYYVNSDGFMRKAEYNQDGRLIYAEDSSGKWMIWGYDEYGRGVYFENSDGFKMGQQPGLREELLCDDIEGLICSAENMGRDEVVLGDAGLRDMSGGVRTGMDEIEK